MDHLSVFPAIDQGHVPDLSRCELRLTMPARAENVMLAREAVDAISGQLGLTGTLLDDMRLAVTEACTNVVRHAYDELGGPLTLHVWPVENGLRVEVTDTGCGDRRRPSPHSAGLGLDLIGALSAQHEVELSPTGGRTVRMLFAPRTGRFTAS